jgi:hypothetical protein
MSVWRGRGRRRYGFFSAEAEDGRGKGESQVRYPQKEIKDYYQYIYDEVIPHAIQYGMPLDEFWHGDLRLFDAYQKAYMRDKSYTAWINGMYIFEANSKVSVNANRTKRTDPVEQYGEWKDPVAKMQKTTITQENLESEFREQQLDQNAWLHNMLSK